MPEPTLLAFRTLVNELADREIVGEARVADGVRVFIAEGHDGAALIAWNDSASADDALLLGHFGDGPLRVVDVFGNEAPAPMRGSRLSLPLTERPVFVKGVDLPLARFRARFRAEPSFIPARTKKHRVELVVENPWPVPAQGRVRIAEPIDWEISPRVMRFQLQPGEERRLPIELSFGLGEDAGPQRMVAEVEVSAQKAYPTLTLPLTMEIGLDTIRFHPSYRFIRDGSGRLADLVVTVQIINVGDSPATLQAFARAPDYAEHRQPVSGLAPGSSVTRHFHFPGGARRLAGRPVRIGLSEQNGTGRLNRTLQIEAPSTSRAGER